MRCHATKLATICFSISIWIACNRKSELHNEGIKEVNTKNQPNSNEQSPNRPQEPKPPFPYSQEEVRYQSVDGITLAGTLTLPNGQQASSAVLLIAGYGRNDRNMSGMGHKYFLVLADYLTRQGVAVLRFDKRGVGESNGVYEHATTKDFAHDAKAGVQYLKSRKEINPKQIGLVGLSEGGLIASIMGGESSDIAFVLLLAPAILTKIADLVEMAGLQMRADGASDEFIRDDRRLRSAILQLARLEPDAKIAKQAMSVLIDEYLVQLSDSQRAESEKLPFAFTSAKKAMLIDTFNSPWYRYFLAIDAIQVLREIKVPVLVLTGDCDWIISPDKAFPILEKCFKEAGNEDYTLMKLPNLNHVFQTCKTGAITEYSLSEETMSPLALKIMAEWMCARTA